MPRTERRNRIISYFLRVRAVEDGEADAVKAGQTAFRADLEIAVTRLCDDAHRVLREAVLVLPDCMAVLCESLVGVESHPLMVLYKQDRPQKGRHKRDTGSLLNSSSIHN